MILSFNRSLFEKLNIFGFFSRKNAGFLMKTGFYLAFIENKKVPEHADVVG